jgi:hypothetical protein
MRFWYRDTDLFPLGTHHKVPHDEITRDIPIILPRQHLEDIHLDKTKVILLELQEH